MLFKELITIVLIDVMGTKRQKRRWSCQKLWKLVQVLWRCQQSNVVASIF